MFQFKDVLYLLQFFVAHGALPDVNLSVKGVLAWGGDQFMRIFNAHDFAKTDVYLLDLQLVTYRVYDPIGPHQKVQVCYGDFVAFLKEGAQSKNIGFAR